MRIKKKLIIGVVVASVLAGLLTGVVFAKPAWKEVTYTCTEVDVPIDIDDDGIVDNLYMCLEGSDGSILVDYYLPDEQWGVTMTIVGTESYCEIGKGKRAEWQVVDCFPWDNPDQYTHPLIAEKQ